MPKFVIERDIPGAGSMTPEQLQAAAMKSVEVLKELGPGIQWLHSYFTDNKVYCVYLAADENIILEHARRGGLPANRISRVRQLLDPSAAEGATCPLRAIQAVFDGFVGRRGPPSHPSGSGGHPRQPLAGRKKIGV